MFATDSDKVFVGKNKVRFLGQQFNVNCTGITAEKDAEIHVSSNRWDHFAGEVTVDIGPWCCWPCLRLGWWRTRVTASLAGETLRAVKMAVTFALRNAINFKFPLQARIRMAEAMVKGKRLCSVVLNGFHIVRGSSRIDDGRGRIFRACVNECRVNIIGRMAGRIERKKPEAKVCVEVQGNTSVIWKGDIGIVVVEVDRALVFRRHFHGKKIVDGVWDE